MNCPDLRPCFKHYRWVPMPHSCGVPVGCDWSDKARDDPTFGLYTQNGSWTMSEIGILFDVARQIGGAWLDIGGATGWTAAHLARAGCAVTALDPMYEVAEFEERAFENLVNCRCHLDVDLVAMTSEAYFAATDEPIFDGVVIDGAHVAPVPLDDAKSALARLRNRGAILFHDVVGAPVQEAVQHLVNAGLQGWVYPTVHGVAVCWRGDLELPKMEGA